MSQWLYRHNLRHEAYSIGKKVYPMPCQDQFAHEFEQAVKQRGDIARKAFYAAHPNLIYITENNPDMDAWRHKNAALVALISAT